MMLATAPAPVMSRRDLVRAAPRWAAGLGAVALGALLLAAFAPSALGARSVIIRSGSMSPTLPVGSVAVAQPIAANDVAVGDIITFEREGAPLPVTHRVIAATASGGGTTLITKGDANPSADSEPLVVPADATLHRVERSVPLVGFVAGFARTPLGALALIVLPIAGIILEPSRQRRRHPCPTCEGTGHSAER